MASTKKCPHDFSPGVYDTLATATAALNKAGLPYAVGGAVGMYAGGYARNTTDVDVFVVEDDLAAVLATLRQAGFLIREVDESQYHAQLPRYAGTKHIVDILVASGAPETLAIFQPTLRRIGTVSFRAFALQEIVASKLTVGLNNIVWLKSLADIAALHSEGLIDLRAIRRWLIDSEIPYVQEFDRAAAEITRRLPNPSYGGREKK